jgi:hypothetical protein
MHPDLQIVLVVLVMFCLVTFEFWSHGQVLLAVRFAMLRFSCAMVGHDWIEKKNEKMETRATCSHCGETREPVDRDDGCTPVWNPENPYRCKFSSHHVARSWKSHLCPKHQSKRRP